MASAAAIGLWWTWPHSTPQSAPSRPATSAAAGRSAVPAGDAPTLPAGTTAGTTAGQIPGCTVTHLSIALVNPNSAKMRESVTITATATTTCVINGWFKVQLLHPAGNLPTFVTRTGVASTITLSPGQTVAQQLAWSKLTPDGGPCGPVATALVVYPPGQDIGTSVPWIRGPEGAVCGGAFDLNPPVGR